MTIIDEKLTNNIYVTILISQATEGCTQLLFIWSYFTHHIQILKKGETHLLTYFHK